MKRNKHPDLPGPIRSLLASVPFPSGPVPFPFGPVPFPSDESLEFLGDNLLSFVLSERLVAMFPGEAEGELAGFKSAMMANAKISEFVRRLRRGGFMLGREEKEKEREGEEEEEEEESEEKQKVASLRFKKLLALVSHSSGLPGCVALLGYLYFHDDDSSPLDSSVLLRIWTRESPLKTWDSSQPRGDHKDLIAFGSSIGITFNNLSLIERSFTHPSVAPIGRSNQQLEFLGDSVIGLVISSFLFGQHPHYSRREFLEARTSLVNNTLFSRIALELGFDALIRANLGEPNPPPVILADAFEAFVGALFLDQSLSHVEAFCRVCIMPHLNSAAAREVVELSAARRILVGCSNATFEIQEEGPPNDRQFVVAAINNGRIIGRGRAKTKKMAINLASQEGLATLAAAKLS